MHGLREVDSDAVLLTYASLVRGIARQFYRPVGMTFEDLTQIGWVGLMKAWHRFDPSRGIKFSTYARPIIRGEISHFMRDEAFLIRIPRREYRSGARVSFRPLERNGEPDESGEDTDLFRVVVEHPEQGFARAEDRAVLNQLLSRVPGKEKAALFLVSEGFDQREIGRLLGCSQIHVSRLWRHARERIVCGVC